MNYCEWDLTDLEAMWDENAQAVERAKRGIDVRGMTRPVRHSYERRWLEQHGGVGPFRETLPPSRRAPSTATARTPRLA